MPRQSSLCHDDLSLTTFLWTNATWKPMFDASESIHSCIGRDALTESSTDRVVTDGEIMRLKSSSLKSKISCAPSISSEHNVPSLTHPSNPPTTSYPLSYPDRLPISTSATPSGSLCFSSAFSIAAPSMLHASNPPSKPPAHPSPSSDVMLRIL